MDGFMERYFPLPQPTSRPTLPAGRERRKCLTIGQGYIYHVCKDAIGVLEVGTVEVEEEEEGVRKRLYELGETNFSPLS